MNHENIELACIALGALALLMQSAILLAIFFGVTKATKKMQDEIEGLRSSVMPVVKDGRELLDTTREFFVRVAPKVEATVTDAAELTRNLRAQAANVEATVDEVLGRVRKQAGRIDILVTGTLDAVDKATAFVTEKISKPVRQISGVLASFKAVVESLSGSSSKFNAPAKFNSSDPKFHEPSVPDDKDMFV
jgi:methyl-accepting chemotaxis protein